VGTAHISLDSVREVEEVMQKVRPDVVFLELCRKRVGILQREQTAPVEVNSEAIKQAFEQAGTMGVAQLLLAQYMANISAKLEIPLGAEFRAAYEAASASKAQVFLGDRPIEITLARALAGMSTWQKLRLACELVMADDITREDIEKLKDTDIISKHIEELGNVCPSIKECIITERDQFMTAQLRMLKAKTVVAVVGLGHCKGIQARWHDAIDTRPLLLMPPPETAVNVRRWLLAGAVGGVVALGVSTYGLWTLGRYIYRLNMRGGPGCAL